MEQLQKFRFGCLKMVHAITTFNCKNGHSNWDISYDSNVCGCHDDGQPCITITCRDCMNDCFKDKDWEKLDKVVSITLPISKEKLKESGILE